MRALVVYESMYGNTHTVAEAVGRGLAETMDTVVVLPVADSDPDLVAGADLLVVGGPTHMHGMASDRTRAMAVKAADDDDDLHLEAHAEGPGLKDWFDGLDGGAGRSAAAFDTRIAKSPVVTGRASKAIARRLHKRGYTAVGEPASFLVQADHLVPGQEAEALEWGRQLGATVDAAV